MAFVSGATSTLCTRPRDHTARRASECVRLRPYTHSLALRARMPKLVLAIEPGSIPRPRNQRRWRDAPDSGEMNRHQFLDMKRARRSVRVRRPTRPAGLGLHSSGQRRSPGTGRRPGLGCTNQGCGLSDSEPPKRGGIAVAWWRKPQEMEGRKPLLVSRFDDSFPRCAWECRLRRSASFVIFQAIEQGPRVAFTEVVDDPSRRVGLEIADFFRQVLGRVDELNVVLENDMSQKHQPILILEKLP